MGTAQEALDLKVMNETMTSEDLKKSQVPETGLARVSEAVGSVLSWPG